MKRCALFSSTATSLPFLKSGAAEKIYPSLPWAYSEKKNDSFVPSAWQTVDISLWINFCEDLVSNFLHLTHSRCLLCFFITSRFPFTPLESLHCLVFKLFFPSLHRELQLSIVASVLNNTIIWAEVPLGLWRSLREILFVSF